MNIAIIYSNDNNKSTYYNKKETFNEDKSKTKQNKTKQKTKKQKNKQNKQTKQNIDPHTRTQNCFQLTSLLRIALIVHNSEDLYLTTRFTKSYLVGLGSQC